MYIHINLNFLTLPQCSFFPLLLICCVFFSFVIFCPPYIFGSVVATSYCLVACILCFDYPFALFGISMPAFLWLAFRVSMCAPCCAHAEPSTVELLFSYLLTYSCIVFCRYWCCCKRTHTIHMYIPIFSVQAANASRYVGCKTPAC